jgi:hypothetical protein
MRIAIFFMAAFSFVLALDNETEFGRDDLRKEAQETHSLTNKKEPVETKIITIIF